jgi:hypothetical protein
MIRELNLEEVARSYGVTSNVYLEYLRLQASYYNLVGLNESLKVAASIIPSKDRLKGIPPERELFKLIDTLNRKIEVLEGRTNNKIGCE